MKKLIVACCLTISISGEIREINFMGSQIICDKQSSSVRSNTTNAKLRLQDGRGYLSLNQTSGYLLSFDARQNINGFFCWGNDDKFYSILKNAKKLKLWQGRCLPISENITIASISLRQEYYNWQVHNADHYRLSYNRNEMKAQQKASRIISPSELRNFRGLSLKVYSINGAIINQSVQNLKSGVYIIYVSGKSYLYRAL